MESVTLDSLSIRRIAEAVPPPMSCAAQTAATAAVAVGADLRARINDLDARLGAGLGQMIDAAAHPRRCAAGELYERGLAAALAGWTAEAVRDLRDAIDLDRYLAAAHLALAYLSGAVNQASVAE